MTYAPLLLPLAPLFAALLAGCSTYTSCSDFKPGTYTQTIELSPEAYEQWQMGVPPGSPTTGATTAADAPGDPAEFPGGTAGPTDDTTGDTGTMLTDQEICAMVCAPEGGSNDLESCTIGALNADGNIPVECVRPSYCEGRRHACVRSNGASAGQAHDPAATWLDPAATWLARAAHDEAASVHAFLALAAELAAHDAPAGLLARIARAAADERRHAALITELAHQHGARVPTPTIVPTPPRDLQALAVENMVEGCVRETWAALSAAHQAQHAQGPALRRIYTAIAADEARHAELAWSIDAWLCAQLGPAGRAMVAAARRAAIRQLQAEFAERADEPALLALGLPDRSGALRLLTGLDAALWSRAA